MANYGPELLLEELELLEDDDELLLELDCDDELEELLD